MVTSTFLKMQESWPKVKNLYKLIKGGLGIILHISKNLSQGQDTNVKHLKLSQTQKTQVSAQTGHLLQNSCQINIGSCVSHFKTSNILHTFYLNCPCPCLATVCPISSFTIFILQGCRLTRARIFSHLQDQLSIGKG